MGVSCDLHNLNSIWYSDQRWCAAVRREWSGGCHELAELGASITLVALVQIVAMAISSCRDRWANIRFLAVDFSSLNCECGDLEWVVAATCGILVNNGWRSRSCSQAYRDLRGGLTRI